MSTSCASGGAIGRGGGCAGQHRELHVRLVGPGNVFVSEDGKFHLIGFGIVMSDRGTHVLKGVFDEWRRFDVWGDRHAAGPSLLDTDRKDPAHREVIEERDSLHTI
jgi:hypothetical protein